MQASTVKNGTLNTAGKTSEQNNQIERNECKQFKILKTERNLKNKFKVRRVRCYLSTCKK